MNMADKLAIIDDIEIEYKKLYNECKKKYNTTREGIDNSLKALANLKTLNRQTMELELKNSIEILLKPILHVTETKHSKLFVSSLSILKKLVTYCLINQQHTVTIIEILKDILDNSSEEFIQIKVLETLLPMVNPSVIDLNESLVNNILIMCLKIFSFKNNLFKNPVSALFKQLMMTIYGFLESFLRPVIEKKNSEKQMKQYDKEKPNEMQDGTVPVLIKSNKVAGDNIPKRDDKDEITSEDFVKIEAVGEENALALQQGGIDISEFKDVEIYKTSLSVFCSLIQIAEGKKKEWIAPTVYSKCLALELLAGVICSTNNLFKYLPEFLDLIRNDLYKILKKNFGITNDFIMGVKLSRISIQIVENLNICYDLISNLIKYSETPALTWQKLIGLECLSSICQNNLLLQDLYNKKFAVEESERASIYDEIINTLTKVSYAIVLTKSQDTGKKKEVGKEQIKHQKQIEISSILMESDITVPTVTTTQVFKLLTDCYINIRDSFLIIIELNGLKVSQVNLDYSPEQEFVRNMLNYDYEAIKGAMIALLLNSTDESMTQTYLNLFQSFINIYGSITLPIARDSYLNDLCKLAIPNNLENSLEMKEKNLLITKTLFNIAHCVNILDFNSWLLLIETMEKIYLMLINSNNYLLKPSEEFEIDVIIRNLEANIKKYSYDLNIESSVLKNSSNDLPIEKKIDENSLNYINEQPQDNASIKEEHISSTQRDPTGIITASNENANVKNLPEKIEDKKKGLFSTLKNALGFSKHKADSSPVKKSLSEEKDDLQILSTATDTLFINSTLYDEVTLKDILRALFESSKQLIEGNSNVTETITTYLNFNLTKMLELCVINVKRIHLLWDTIVSMVTYISQKNISNISRFALDVITIIDMFILTQYQNQGDKASEWSRERWQKTLFHPLSTVAQLNISQEINLNIVYNLSKILQNCGLNFNGVGWTSYIEICECLISKSDEAQCEHTFKLIEQLLSEYSGYLTIMNISPIMKLLEKFALYKRNNNISYSAITLFWSCANMCEHFQQFITIKKEDFSTNEKFIQLTDFQREFFTNYCPDVASREAFFNYLWIELFAKLLKINSDNRFDVRKSGINIFADIYVAKSSLIANEIALGIINTHFLEVLEESYTILEDKLKTNRAKKSTAVDSGNQRKTPKFSDHSADERVEEIKSEQMKPQEKKIKFDEETVAKLANMPNIDEKEWEDTTILSIQALGKTVKAFLLNNQTFNIELSYYKDNILTNLVEKYLKIMRFTTPEIATHILKSFHEIKSANNPLFLTYFEYIWNIYEEMGRFITSDFFLTQLYIGGNKMIFNVLENLKEIFLKDCNIKVKPDLLKGQNLENLLNYLIKLIKSARNSEGIQTITNPQRLLHDEKNIFEFAEKVSALLNDYQSWSSYCNFLSSYLKLELNDLHCEAHCRKVLELFDSFYANKSIDPSFVKEYLPKLIMEITDLACLRNQPDYVVALIKNNKSQLQLWHFATVQLIKILHSVLCGGKKEEKERSEYAMNFNTGSIEEETPISTQVDAIRQNLNMNVIWESVIICFEAIFKQSEGGYKGMVKNVQEELIKSCQEMEIQIINFIVNGLLPNSMNIQKEMQIKLLILLDMGSNFDYNILNSSYQVSSGTSSISKVCISNLFELCKFRSEETLRKEVNSIGVEDFLKIKIKIAKMCTPILIKRCKETLKKFLDDEIKSGTMPLARSRLEDAKFVLDKLKNLEIYPNYTNIDEEQSETGSLISGDCKSIMDIIMKSKKSHLLQLLPLLSEFITTKENEIKILIKEIFKIITIEMGIK